MSETVKLVDHFFRHESGRLVALLTRHVGARHLELVEDVVQSALARALVVWPRQGLPSEPSAWLYRTARNLAIDALRRDDVALRIQSRADGQADELCVETTNQVRFDDEVGDEPLRMLFLCCHPSIPWESRAALALKTVSGFSSREISVGLLTTESNVERRLTRAKQRLSELDVELVELTPDQARQRLDSVQATVYLIFNEGFSASQGSQTIRQELCEEAIRLARMMALHPVCQIPASHALLALFLLHAARLPTRLDADGCAVLLEHQDRSGWRWDLIRDAMEHMESSARGDQLSRYHLEAAIAWEHCRASNFSATDWKQVLRLYQMLSAPGGNPMIGLNEAIATSYAVGPEAGLMALRAISDIDRKKLRPWWDCSMAQVYQRLCDQSRAISHWRDAAALATSDAQRTFIAQRLARLTA